MLRGLSVYYLGFADPEPRTPNIEPLLQLHPGGHGNLLGLSGSVTLCPTHASYHQHKDFRHGFSGPMTHAFWMLVTVKSRRHAFCEVAGWLALQSPDRRRFL